MRALDNAINNICYCTSGSKSTGLFMTSLMLLKRNVHHHTTSPTTTPPLPSLTSAPQICSKPEHASKWTHSFLAWQNSQVDAAFLRSSRIRFVQKSSRFSIRGKTSLWDQQVRISRPWHWAHLVLLPARNHLCTSPPAPWLSVHFQILLQSGNSSPSRTQTGFSWQQQEAQSLKISRLLYKRSDQRDCTTF